MSKGDNWGGSFDDGRSSPLSGGPRRNSQWAKEQRENTVASYTTDEEESFRIFLLNNNDKVVAVIKDDSSYTNTVLIFTEKGFIFSLVISNSGLIIERVI